MGTAPRPLAFSHVLFHWKAGEPILILFLILLVKFSSTWKAGGVLSDLYQNLALIRPRGDVLHTKLLI
jgi:hypothetical protein